MQVEIRLSTFFRGLTLTDKAYANAISTMIGVPVLDENRNRIGTIIDVIPEEDKCIADIEDIKKENKL